MLAVYGSRRRVSRGFFLCCSLARSVYKLSHDLRRMSIIRPFDRPCVTLWDCIRAEHRDRSGHTGKSVHEEMMNINLANCCTKPVFLAMKVCLAIRLWCTGWWWSHSRCAVVEATVGTRRFPVSLVRNLPPTTGLVLCIECENEGAYWQMVQCQTRDELTGNNLIQHLQHPEK